VSATQRNALVTYPPYTITLYRVSSPHTVGVVVGERVHPLPRIQSGGDSPHQPPPLPHSSSLKGEPSHSPASASVPSRKMEVEMEEGKEWKWNGRSRGESEAIGFGIRDGNCTASNAYPSQTGRSLNITRVPEVAATPRHVLEVFCCALETRT
jgi:hypothetical protein